MTQETNKRIHQIYSIVVSILTVLAGICFIAACCNIYYSGIAADVPQIYTSEIIAESFSKIAIPVYLCLAAVIGGIILNLALPLEKAKRKPEKNLPLILARLQEKTNLESCDPQLRSAIESQGKNRKLLSCIAGALLAVGAVIFLVYTCIGSNWGGNSAPSMLSAMYMLLGCLTIPFAYTVFCAYACRSSLNAEIELMRQAAAQAPRQAEKATPKSCNCRCAAIARIAILAVGVVLVVLGACNEGTADILTKAVNICTECVGLG